MVKERPMINEILKIKYPLIQGGMANIATGEFAAAVSNAGAFGVIGSGGMDINELKANIERCRELTDKPFGVNIMLMSPFADQMAQLVIEERVGAVTTGAGNPGKYVEKWKSAGIKVLPVVSSVALAKRMERLGVDGIIAEGAESGGHVGEMTTMTLVPQVADAVSVPVIAAGGIGNGRQVLASFILGASGVQVGTCLLVSEECPIHENYKTVLLKAKDNSTVVTGRIAGAPVRILKNGMAREYIKREKEGASIEELEKYTLGSLRKAVKDGDTENGSLMAGQVIGQLSSIRPLKEIIEGMFLECAMAYGTMNSDEFLAEYRNWG
jgi:enoyl-[acyl-carrier protein] reductase II